MNEKTLDDILCELQLTNKLLAILSFQNMEKQNEKIIALHKMKASVKQISSILGCSEATARKEIRRFTTGKKTK